MNESEKNWTVSYDLCASEGGRIFPGFIRQIETGLSFNLFDNQLAWITSSPELEFRKGIKATGPNFTKGFKNRINIWLQNTGRTLFIFERGDKLARIKIQSDDTVALVLRKN